MFDVFQFHKNGDHLPPDNWQMTNEKITNSFDKRGICTLKEYFYLFQVEKTEWRRQNSEIRFAIVFTVVSDASACFKCRPITFSVTPPSS